MTRGKSKASVQDAPTFFYAEALAIALVGYALTDHLFHRSLRRMIREANLHIPTEPSKHLDSRSVELLAPATRVVAKWRAQWLIERLSEASLPGHAGATNALSHLLRDDPNPQSTPEVFCDWDKGALPIGTKGVFITGLIIGKIEQTVITRPNLASATQAMHAMIASTGVIAKAMANADMDARKLEPELSSWLFGDRETRFYESSDEIAIDEILRELERLDVTHATSSDSDGLAAIAISPAFTGSLKLLTWTLRLVA